MKGKRNLVEAYFYYLYRKLEGRDINEFSLFRTYQFICCTWGGRFTGQALNAPWIPAYFPYGCIHIFFWKKEKEAQGREYEQLCIYYEAKIGSWRVIRPIEIALSKSYRKRLLVNGSRFWRVVVQGNFRIEPIACITMALSLGVDSGGSMQVMVYSGCTASCRGYL